MNTEFKKIIDRFKNAQNSLGTFLSEYEWVGDAKTYANQKSKEIKKMFATDSKKMRILLEKEKKNLEKFKKDLPKQVKKIKNFLESQTGEISSLISKVGISSKPTKKKIIKKAPKKKTQKKAPQKITTTNT